MPVLLAIETSQHTGGVALRDASGNIDVEYLAPKKRHDDDLMPAIDRLFARSNLTPRDLKDGAVGVSIGPGGFTGLRIAVSTAKMLAESLATQLIAVPTALVAAESSNSTGPIIVTLASKGEYAWCTRLSRTDEIWRIDGTPGLCNAHSLDLHGVATLLGDEHLPEPMRLRCEQLDVKVIRPQLDPRACLAVAERMLRAGSFTDPLQLAPLYPRQPEAVTLWEQKSK